MSTLALIPARGGSKSIPRKNIKPVAGFPLISFSIVAALEAHSIDRVIVSTDDEEIAAIAREWGAEVPFMRPAALAQDHSTDLEVFQHAYRWLQNNEQTAPELFVHLRPTYPIREVADIDAMVRLLQENPHIDSVRSIAPAPETPFKMWFQADDGLLSPVVQTTIPEAYNQPRQSLPQAYLQNASIDVVRACVVMEQSSMTGQQILGYRMDHIYDIDTSEHLRAVEDAVQNRSVFDLLQVMRAHQSPPAPLKTFCIDIDGVIATLVPGNQYDQAGPVPTTIDAINFLYERGHRIILFTARGSATGLDWAEVTRQQMATWGVKYTELHFGKPAADYYVDDKAMLIAQFHAIVNDLGHSERK